MKYGFSLVGLRVLDGCHEHIRRVLSEGWYLFNSWYRVEDHELVVAEDYDFVREMYGRGISVQAIVGKNGSGKSSVMELVYRIVNNLSVVMLRGMERPAAWPLQYVRGVYAVLYFESGGKLGSITCRDEAISYQWGENKAISWKSGRVRYHQSETDRQRLEQIAKRFCYTLVCNYATMSLVASDFSRDVCSNNGGGNGEWIDGIYNKNDGYQAALGFEPYKGGGIVDTNRMKQLNDERLASILILSKRRGIPVLDNYHLDEIWLAFQEDMVSGKYRRGSNNEIYRHPEHEIGWLWRKKVSVAFWILKSYGFDYFNLKDEIIRTAMAYLVYKTLSVGSRYPQYKVFRGVADKENYAKKVTNIYVHKADFSDEFKKFGDEEKSVDTEWVIAKLCDRLKGSSSHVELKIRQVLHFLEAVDKKYRDEGLTWKCPKFATYDEYMRTMFPGFEPNSPAEILDFYPPQFFSDSITLECDNVRRPLYSLSAGEKQFMQLMATVVYHLRNIVSVAESRGLAKYRNVNLMFDEVETCFHPEYQQKFIKALIDMLRHNGISDKININIMVATHSPFILSDIPDTNILFLEHGQVPATPVRGTFCGNVCELLRQSFFLTSGFMGYYAREIISDLLAHLNGEERRQSCLQPDWNSGNSQELISLIGEPMLKNSLMELWNRKYGSRNIDELLEWHRAEIIRLERSHRNENS